MCHTERPHFARFACKTTFAAFLSLSAVFVVGCGRANDNNAAPTTSATPGTSDKSTTSATPSTGPFKIALVMSGSSSDNGWNAGAKKALDEVQQTLGLSKDDTAFVENATTPDKQQENLRAFASKGYRIVFAHGAEYEDLALKMESDFPNTMFVVSSGAKTGHNTTPIVIRLEDGAYLEGMLAAGMSKSGKIGAVGAQKIPPVESVFKAFEAGAKAVKPDITVVPPVYTNDWEDVGKAKQAALALIDQGADVLIQDLDAGAQGVFNAVQERKDKGVYALGTNNDQNSAAPDVILASAPIYIEKAFVPIAQGIKAGSFTPSDKAYGMPEGLIGFVLNPQLESKIPADLKKKLEDTEKTIKDGSFAVPKGSG